MKSIRSSASAQNKPPKQIARRAGVVKPVEAVNQSNGEYWHLCAEKARRRANRYQNEGVRQHMLRIADGYEELARRASAEQASES